jgi:predicted secreted Zn-dependent protease
VTFTELAGTVDYTATVSASEEGLGCRGWTARYLLSGRRENVRLTPPPPPTPAPDSLVDLPGLSVEAVPGATILYFPVSGSTVSELRSSMAAAGVKACGEITYEWWSGSKEPAGCEVTTFEQTLEGLYDPAGVCHLTGDLSLSYTVHIPRWVAPSRVPAPLLDWWRVVIVFIRDHEAGHVAISQRYDRLLDDRLAAATCDTVNSVLDQWVSELNAAQEAYDRAQYKIPWPRPPSGY